jgi:threonine dehydratase
MGLAAPEALARGVWTPSAGNMAQGVAWEARRRGIPCAVVAPDNAPRAKIDAIERLGGRVVPVPLETWWKALVEHAYPGMDGLLIHPVADRGVIAGNGTIGLEIVEDLPDVDAVLVPYGGGGLSCGIAAALRELRPEARVWACEVETAAPLAASLAQDRPARIVHRASFVDGIGGGSVLPEMWPMVKTLLAGSITVSLDETAEAIRLLVRRARVVAEGAGAASVAAALSERGPRGKIVCVVSGGNIDAAKLAAILAGQLP